MKAAVLMLIVLFSGCAHSKDAEVPVGSWEPAETVECPDILVIEKSGEYAVYNDCYGVVPNCPIIVEGAWRESIDEILMERRIVNRGGTGPFAEEQLLILEVSNGYIWRLDQQGKRIEKFRRTREEPVGVTC